MSVAMKINPTNDLETSSATLKYSNENSSTNDASLAVVVGSENEKAIDISALRSNTGLVTLDEGYGNTASCKSDITFLDGEQGILRYRGYPIEQLAQQKSFLDVSYLLLHGELPNKSQSDGFRKSIDVFANLPKHTLDQIRSFPSSAHPMAILSSVIGSYGGFFEKYLHPDPDKALRDEMFSRLVADTKNLVAEILRHTQGKAQFAPAHKDDTSDYSASFLLRCFDKVPSAKATEALNLLLILHADHEQNCSTSTVRLVGSSKANLFSCIASGIQALWGPLHGGANQAVIEMLIEIEKAGGNHKQFLAKAKDKSDSFKLMGFGHRVYKNFDPRAKLIKVACDQLIANLGYEDPLLKIAKGLEVEALKDDYFVSRKLYPNVDFYSGIIYRALGIPTNMFTAMFALGRLPGWLAQWQEMRLSPEFRIGRPRQIYTGKKLRNL